MDGNIPITPPIISLFDNKKPANTNNISTNIADISKDFIPRKIDAHIKKI